ITIDTLRPDALGIIEASRDTPAIDALAESGRLFSSAVSPVPLTLPSHTSMLTGLLPVHHGVRDNGQTVPADVELLPVILKNNGFSTGAFVSGFPLQAMFGLDRGFDRYDDVMNEGDQGWVERRAEDTATAASAWLQGQGGSQQPWFAWTHFYDPHDPYEPPREFWQPGPRGNYDGEVTYTDYWVGKLLETARAASGDRPLLIVLTADHAEALGEHEELTHGFFVYDSTMRVPLIISWPGRISPSSGAEPVQLIDLAATILELLDLPPLARTDGRSLAQGLMGGELALHPALMETWLPWTYYGWAPLSAWLDGPWKLIDAPEVELFDVLGDPHEAANLANASPAIADRLGLALGTMAASAGRVAGTSSDDDAMQRLRSLGYVGVGAPVEAPPDDLADPKSRIAMRNTLQQGESLLRAQRYAAAAEIFADVLATDPDNRFANLRQGIAFLRLGRIEDATRVLTHAVEVEPRRAEARYALGDALMRSDAFSAAADQWAVLAELQPRRKEAWFNLASALEKSGQSERAKLAMQEYRRLEQEESAAASSSP
ncbi:sulfatase-like hydrolase/transferase, partial [Dokdonella sp.]|uniref:sulfatase-like hydrolase/transferase n=1 Tax=Dokdonella sp. TaxID=2291710 RepID=UPI003C3A2D64